ncbi:MAG: hypothetical protein R3F11_10355 [Verrucomicrobiales bacterium]
MPMRLPLESLAKISLARALGEDGGKEAGAKALGEMGIDAKALAEAKREPEFLARRAAHLIADDAPLRAAFPPRWIGPAVAAVGLLAGFGTNALGGDRLVNIIAFPILGLALWNLAVYALVLWGKVAPRRAADAEPGPLRRLVANLAARAAGIDPGKPESDPRAAFLRGWLRDASPYLAARSAAWLHAAALMLAAGAVGGMYLDGLVREYRAGWESTFFTPDSLGAVLRVALAPGAAILPPSVADLPALTDPAHLAALRNAGAPEIAAPWIHLYAATAALLIGVPRLLLFGFERARAARLARAFPAPPWLAAHAASALREQSGAGRVIRIVPYAFTPGSRNRDAARAKAHEIWGGNVWVDFAKPVPYGGEDAFLAEGTEGDPDAVVPLFNLASTPEEEAHGKLVGELASRSGGALVALLDVSPMREKLAGLRELDDRLSQRTAVWQRLLEKRGARGERIG